MATIRVVSETTVPPERVLKAAYDFSERRAQLFPAVELEHFKVHEIDGDSADVTEGTKTGPFGTNWERCRYDCSQPGSVRAPVTDSNVYEPAGSSWEIRATPNEGGSQVEMVWERQFKRSPRGIIFGALFRTVGKPIFRRYGQEVIENLEQLDKTSGAAKPTPGGTPSA
ncbi:MAG: SRPBCC family protein [Solirubrobacterales bacterium]